MSSSPDASIVMPFGGVYKVPDPKNPSKRLIATKNLTPGRTVYGEQLFRTKLGEELVELRFWDPFRSKLAASIQKGLEVFPFKSGETCLYLGASTGTTVSHISDIIGESGKIFAVEVAPRVARELLENVVKYRKNIVPIIADARHPQRYPSIYGKISTVYCDIAQPDQTEIAIENCKTFLERGGLLFLVVKASSIDVLKSKTEVFADQRKMLESSGFTILQQIDLEPYDRNHAMIVTQYSASA